MPCSLESQISHLPCNTKVNVSGVGGRGYCPDCAPIPCSLGSQISQLPCNTKVNVSVVGVGVTVQTLLCYLVLWGLKYHTFTVTQR